MKVRAAQLDGIVERYYSRILVYCRARIGDAHDAEDLAQEVFLALSERYREVEHARVGGWLYAVAYNKIVDYYRISGHARERILPFDEAGHIALPEPGESFTDEDEQACFAKLLARLTDDERRLFEAVYTRKTRYAELAAEYGISEAALRKRVSRLGRKLRKFIRMTLNLLLVLLTA